MTEKLLQSEIDDLCIYLKDNISENYPAYQAHMHFLYYYGVRISELFEGRIYPADNSNEIVIFPKKRNNIRNLKIVSPDTAEMLEVLAAKKDIFHLNKKNLERIIKNTNLYAKISIGNKNVGAHVFRHNWVKKQIASGKQISTVQTLLGERDIKSLRAYLYSKIEVLQ